MKRKLGIIAAIAVCLSILSVGTLAYFTSEEKAENVITSGNVLVELQEQTTGADGELVAWPKDGLNGVMPGSEVSKIVSVKNTGSGEAWVRITREVTIAGADGEKLPVMLEAPTPDDVGTAVEPAVSFDDNTKAWIVGDDGAFYFNSKLAAGQTTDALFNNVTLNKLLPNEYQDCTVNVVISIQAVQCANNGDSVLEAQGWPAA